MIRSELHSDDFGMTAKFDARPWFEQADVAEIVELAECGWGGDVPADDVARHVEDLRGYEDVGATLDYARRKRSGFECHVHQEDALRWLQENRNDVFSEVCAALDEDPDRIIPLESTDPAWDNDTSWDGDYCVPAAAAAPAP